MLSAQYMTPGGHVLACLAASRALVSESHRGACMLGRDMLRLFPLQPASLWFEDPLRPAVGKFVTR